MAMPVKSVSNTRIFVGCDQVRTRQLTVYEMAVVLQTPGNAMILPVPASDPSEVELLDLTLVPKFFAKFIRAFEPLTLGLDVMRGSRSMEPLKVHDVGNYRVSIAGSVADLSRVDPAVFQLSAETAETLTSYGEGFVFVVATFRESGKFHPLAYTHPMPADGTLFVPTRHEHGDKHLPSQKRDTADAAFFDHDICRQESSQFVQPLGRFDKSSEVSATSPDGYGGVMADRWATDQMNRVPGLMPFLRQGQGARLVRSELNGPFKNMDLSLRLT